MPPCSFMNCSAGMASVLSRIWRAAFVGFAHLALLFVGQRHDAQGKDLVDLGSVEQIAGALRGNLRIVVQNDGRCQHGVTLAWVAHQHRPHADVLALRSQFLQLRRRLQQRDEFSAFDTQHQVRGNQRLHQCVIATTAALRGVVLRTRMLTLNTPGDICRTYASIMPRTSAC